MTFGSFKNCPQQTIPLQIIYNSQIAYFPGLLAGPSGIRVGWGIKQWQIRGQKAPNFEWATFGWASCNLCTL